MPFINWPKFASTLADGAAARPGARGGAGACAPANVDNPAKTINAESARAILISEYEPLRGFRNAWAAFLGIAAVVTWYVTL
jgi:hypothetical protein